MVLHVQTDTGLSGGIAGYVSTLVRASELEAYRFVTVVPGAEGDPVRTRGMYGAALPVALPSSYGLRTWRGYVRALEHLVIEHRIALMHAHALRSALACAWVSRRTGVPFVYTNHGLRFTQKPAGLARRVFRTWEAWVCQHARAVVAIRPFDTSRLLEARLVAPERLHTVPTRIDARLASSKLTTQRPCPPSLLGIGSLIDVKRPDRFIEWVHALQLIGTPVQASWIGDGPLRGALQEQASRRGVDIHWRGHLEPEEVAIALSQACALALTSQFEVFPLVALEAYSHGVPVVAGRFDGVQDFLEEGRTGLIVPADDPGRVATSLTQLLADRERWQAFSYHARQLFAARFEGSGRMAADYAALYRACLS